MNTDTPTLAFPDDISRAATLIQAGECVAIKTETVYGLAADATNERAIAKIFEAKARPASNPLIVHVASAADMAKWAKDIPDIAFELASAFWPGPLSILLKKQYWVLDAVTGGQDTVVLRCPASKDFISLIQASGTGLAAPSANRYKFISPTNAAHVLTSLNGRIAAVVDGGSAEVGIESTIIDVTQDVPTILRPGPIDDVMLERALGRKVRYAANLGITVPGSAKQHYQPDTPVFLLSTEELERRGLRSNEGVISYSQPRLAGHLDDDCHIQLSDNASEYSVQFYAALHQLDKLALSCIYLESTPTSTPWIAINNRIGRVVAG